MAGRCVRRAFPEPARNFPGIFIQARAGCCSAAPRSGSECCWRRWTTGRRGRYGGTACAVSVNGVSSQPAAVNRCGGTACAVSVNGVSSQPAAVNRCGGTACARRRTPRSARARVVLRLASASPPISPDLPRSPHRWSADWQASGGACRALRFGGGLLGRSPRISPYLASLVAEQGPDRSGGLTPR